MKKLTLLLTTIFFLFISLQQNIFACSCDRYLSVCQAYDSAESVFLGTVTKVVDTKIKSSWVETLPNGKEKRETVKGWKHYIKVEKTYKGTQQNEIVLAIENDYCSGIKYPVGSKLLLYVLYDKEGKVWLGDGYCGRSGYSRQEDLYYLNGLPKTLTQTIITGNFRRFEDKPDKNRKRSEILANSKLTISSKTNSYNLTTDENGNYQIYDLPPDTYEITPETLEGLIIRFPIYYGFGGVIEAVSNKSKSVTVDLKENRCVGVSFVFKTDTSVSGKY